jgi:hypothetical protein
MAVFKITNFIGGVNESVDEMFLKENEAKKLSNCKVNTGALERVNGSTLYANLSHSVQSLMSFYGGGGTQLVYSGNGTLTSSWYGTLSSVYDANMDYVNFHINGYPVIIITSASDTPMVWDGNSGSTPRKILNRRRKYDEKTGELIGYIDGNSATVTTEGEVSTYAPSGRYIELHYDRLWIAGNYTYPNRVFFSTAGVNGSDIDDWTFPIEEGEANQHGGFIDCSSWDGGIIVGLRVLFDDIVIFKTKNMYKIFGTYPGNYQKVELFSSSGGIADKSIAKGNSAAYFIATEGIFEYNGTNVSPVSQKIQETWKQFSIDDLKQCVGTFYKNKYIASFPSKGIVIEYDTLLKNFIIREGVQVNAFLTLDDKLLCSNYTSQIYMYNLGDTFNGQVINSKYESGLKDIGGLNTTKTTQYLYFTGRGNGNIKFTLKSDRDNTGKSITIPLTSTETAYKKKLKNKGRLLNLVIENVDGSYFNIKDIEMPLDIDVD